MKRTKFKYEEGTWFLVPLDNRDFVAGVVARSSFISHGILLGYFFSDVYDQLPTLDTLCHLKPRDAQVVIRFGDMGLKNGEWPIVGKCVNWSSKDWAMPSFVREEPLTGRRYEVLYDPNDPAQRLSEQELKVDERKDLGRDSLYGHSAVQRYMAHVLGYEVPALDLEKLQDNKKTSRRSQRPN
jgi:hypothetical protein